MRNLYWILAIGVIVAIAAAAWFAGQLGPSEPQIPVPEPAYESEVVVEEPAAPPEVPEEDYTKPSFDIVRISRNGTGVVAGRSAPNAEVELYANEGVIAKTKADGNGEWVIILSQPLASGTTTFSLRAETYSGANTQSDNVVVVDVPEGPDGGVLAVMSPRDGSGPSRALQIPGASETGAMQLRVSSMDFLPDGTVVVSGTAGADQAMRVYVNNAYINEVTADASGQWMLNLGVVDGALESELRVDQIGNEDAAVMLRLVQPFSKEGLLDPAAAQRTVVVQRGNNLWAIARAVYGTGPMFSLIFDENAAQIRNPDLIYPGQIFDLPSESPSP